MVSKHYDVFHDGELFIVRWREPSEEAAAQLAERIERRHAELGKQLLFVVLLGPDCTPPDKATRDVLLDGHDRIYALTHSVRVVIMGEGFRQTMVRTAVTGMMLVAGLRGQPFSVDKSVLALARAVAPTLQRDPAKLVRKLVDSGLVSAGEAEAEA